MSSSSSSCLLVACQRQKCIPTHTGCFLRGEPTQHNVCTRLHQQESQIPPSQPGTLFLSWNHSAQVHPLFFVTTTGLCCVACLAAGAWYCFVQQPSEGLRTKLEIQVQTIRFNNPALFFLIGGQLLNSHLSFSEAADPYATAISTAASL